MGRKMEYFCDEENCGKVFGNTKHINVKNGSLFVSTYDKEKKQWRQTQVHIGGSSELHFCNTRCLKRYIDAHIKDAELAVKE